MGNSRKFIKGEKIMEDHKVLLHIPMDLWSDLEIKRIEMQKEKGSNYQKKDHLLDILRGADYGKKANS